MWRDKNAKFNKNTSKIVKKHKFLRLKNRIQNNNIDSQKLWQFKINFKFNKNGDILKHT